MPVRSALAERDVRLVAPSNGCSPALADSRCGPAVRYAASAQVDSPPDDYWAAPRSADRYVPAAEPVAPAAGLSRDDSAEADSLPDAHSASPDSLPVGSAERRPDDRCGPGVPLVVPDDYSAAPHSAQDATLVVDVHCAAVALQHSVVPDDCSRPADLPAQVAFHPDAYSPRVLPADCRAGSQPELESEPESASQVSLAAPPSPFELEEHFSNAASAIPAAATLVPDAVAAPAAAPQTGATAEAA